jgi:hypothetical protein
MINPLLASGRWIRKDDVRKLAISEAALEFYPGLKPGDPPSLRASDIVLALTAAVILLVLVIGICMQVRNWMMAG